MKKILRDHWLLIFLISGLFLRLALSFIPGFKIDVDAWFAWAIRLSTEGFRNFYSDNIWTNYTPGYLYILKILGDLQYLFKINSEVFYVILKIPAILSDLILALIAYHLVIKNHSKKLARIAACLIIFNPAIIFNSTIWGQIDSVLTLALILSTYYLSNKNLLYSSIFYGIALLIKPQAIALAPVFLLFLLKNFSIKNLFSLSLPGIFMLTIFSIPFFGIQSLSKLSELFLKMTGDYPYTSLFAYNLWGVIGFWIKDNEPSFLFSYQQWGYLLFFIFWLIIGGLYLFKKNFSVYILATLGFLAFYFLPTRVHERYLYPVLPLLLILIFQYQSKILSIATYYLNFIYFLNLYFVYMYYNYHYLKIPSDFYSQSIYNFLDIYSKQLSLISTLIFITISYILINQKNDKKFN